MTEAEWLAATDPTPMMLYLRTRVSGRKLRLAAVAVARLLSHRLPEEMRGAVAVGERVADGLAGSDEQVPFVRKLYGVCVEHGGRTGENWFAVTPPEEVAAVFSAIRAVGCGSPNKDVINSPAWQLILPATAEHHPPILRDVVGNPFCQVTADPKWLTPPVLALAEGIYADRAFDQMPILADALQDAGCEHADILTHCRGDGPHVRGCWVVDLLLGKQ